MGKIDFAVLVKPFNFVQVHILYVVFQNSGLFQVSFMSWEVMKDRLAEDRSIFAKELSQHYDCVMAFGEIAVDLK